ADTNLISIKHSPEFTKKQSKNNEWEMCIKNRALPWAIFVRPFGAEESNKTKNSPPSATGSSPCS
ncbi:MAG: hypothetical protein KGQ89_10505, partial [Verrucomicrobia bacterium]|nr:hypothetical protein [Verrucomicrobiota bacterium]